MSPKAISITKRDQEQVLLRADLKDAKTIAALKAIGLKSPDLRRREGDDKASIMWFSPDEALIFVGNAQNSIDKMKDKLPAKHLVHDATGARVVFTISGDYLRDLLAKGTPQDLMKVETGQVVRTHIGQFAVAFWFIDEQTVELVGFRSFADGIQKWLEVEAQSDALPVLQS